LAQRVKPISIPSGSMEPAEPAVRARWEPEEVASGLFRLPLPYVHAASVNVLVAPGPEGVLMVDAGHPSEEARVLLDTQLSALGIDRGQIRTILLTHLDHDHSGFARELQEASGARVLVHRRELGRGPLWRGSMAWLEANGYDGPPRELPVDDAALPERLDFVEDGEHLRWTGLDLRLLHCPGHSPGLLCALDESRRLLLSSDQVLRGAFTPVGLFSPDGDPLNDYLESLERLRGLAVDLVVPGHGRAFGGLRERVESLAAGVHRELDRIHGLLGPEPATAWELAGRRQPDLDPRRRAMAMFMVLAGLRRLEKTGRATVHAAGGRFSYSLSPPAG
jgi:glyoxylase-like metal-dependent hydrolase (beta-lactamase superfamily II)